MQISPSAIVRVRRARWRIVDVRAYEDCRLLTLSGVGPANGGAARRVLAPFDTVEPIDRRARVARVSRRLWRRACRALVAEETPPAGALRSARRARIDLLPHQLEPALAVVRGLGCRILLADDVGLGKTIQAGLVLSELRVRGAADRILILTPAGLRDQWSRELSGRLELDAAVVDATAIKRSICTLPVGVNPWKTVPIAITSIDYIKQPDVLASAAACRWDVIVVDEAHGVSGESDRRAAVAALAARAPYVVLLTATPHSGDREAFLSLCRLGFASRTHFMTGPPKGGPYQGHEMASDDPLLVFRRTRHDVRIGAGRRVHRLHVRSAPAELRMHRMLARFSQAVRRERGTDDQALWLALSVLHKRALSSARSLQQSVERRLATLISIDEPNAAQPCLPFTDPEGELTAGDLSPAWPSVLALNNPSRERHMLRLLAAAAATAAKHETKIAFLLRLLRRINEPAIVFTEYRDTLLNVHAAVGDRAAILHGGMTRSERLAQIDAFTRGARPILLATDAAGEGLNLHHTCRVVINLELPWNPMRLEQRIGRVDRIGQPRTVHAFHLVARNSGEHRILDRLMSRVACAQADIAAPDPIGLADEQAMARFAIEGDETAVQFAPGAADYDAFSAATAVCKRADDMLTADAVAEAARMAEARRLIRAGDERALASVDASGTWWTKARNPKTRASLGQRMLMLWRASLADGFGRHVASTVVPVTLALARPDGVARPGDLVRRLNEADETTRARVDDASAMWRNEAASLHKAFIAARVARERAIAEANARAPSSIFQPGLFDRRAQRARSAVDAADRDNALGDQRRLAALELEAALSNPQAQLLLVLLP